MGRQHLHSPFRISRALLDQANQAPEGRMRRVPNTFIHPTLTTRHRDPLLRPQPIQRNEHLPSVAAADPIRDNVDPVPRVAQVQRRLCDADVCLYPDQRDVRPRGQRGGDGGDVHGELGLVVGRRGEEGVNGRDRWTELGGGLGGRVDGEGEEFGEG